MGRRVYLGIPDEDYKLLRPGEYVKGAHHWWGRTPTCGSCPDGALVNLEKHDVTVHENGTITVKDAIEATDSQGHRWHGFLERGTWREC